MMNVALNQKKVNKKKQRITSNRDASVAQLPNEILILIFVEANSEPVSISRAKTTKFSRDEWGNSHLPETTGYCNMAVVISHVCPKWRAVSLDIPDLWTTFYYVAYLSNSRTILERLDAFLKRSTTQLLDIWIDFRGSIGSVRRNKCQALTTKALRHIKRWRSFILIPDSAFSVSTLFNQLKDLAAPNLETFLTPAAITEGLRSTLNLPNAGGLADIPVSPLISKKGVPKLSVLRMDKSGFYLNLLPLSNISTLYLHNEDTMVARISIDLWLFSMESSANLTRLTLDGVFIGPYLSTSPWPPPIVLPNLIHFRLCNLSIHRSNFSHFQLPLLETLTFYKVEYEGEGVYQPVDIPNLHSLFLVDSNTPDNGISLTRLTTTITTIVLSDSRSRSAGIRPMGLLDYDHAQQGWPMLQDITVNLRNLGKFGLEFYLRCFQARPKIPSITLRIDSSLLTDWQTRFAPRLALLEDLCTIETLDPLNPNIPSPWPIDTQYGPFKTLHENLDPPLIKRYSTYYSNI